MRFLPIFVSATRSLTRAPLRSALTSLGVIVGVAALVATVSIGSGAQEKLKQLLSTPGARTIVVASYGLRSGARNKTLDISPSDGLHIDDYYSIRRAIPDIAAATPRVYLSGASLHARGFAAKGNVDGISEEGLESGTPHLLDGTMFSRLEVARAASVCLVSEAIATVLADRQSPIGQTIYINQAPFAIIGVVANLQTGPSAAERSFRVYVPFTTLQKRLDRLGFMSFSVQARNIEHMESMARSIDDLMLERAGPRNADFRARYAHDAINAYAEGSLSAARSLAAMAVVSLLVGGIGIMNVMLAAISQRTREVGIRLALGSRSSHILMQFLAESSALSLMGGIAGLVLGCLAAWAITWLYEWPTSITGTALATAFFSSLAVGMFFGYHPARRAALSAPTEALRAEL